MCLIVARTYFCDWSTPGRARGLCTDLLTEAIGYEADAQALIDDTALVVSELVTNAVKAGSPQLQLDVELHRDHLRMIVADTVAGVPAVQDPSPSEETGRGLNIVQSLATTWGVDHIDGGKQVWAELAVPPHLGAGIDCAL